MVDIAKHIRTLLYDYSVVIVPDFGAFSTRYSPAKINREQNQVEPPRKEVYFNQALKINDNLLASHIAKAEQISQESGREHIKRFVAQCENTLRSGNPLNLDKIGIFSADSNGAITFKADANSNFSKDAFGLKPVATDTEAATLAASDTMPEPAVETAGAPPPASHINGSHNSISNRESNPEPTPKKTIADVLADNAKKIQAEEGTDMHEPAIVPQYPEEKPKRGIMGKLLWVLPILALILGCSLAYQLWNNFNDTGADADWANSLEGVTNATRDAGSATLGSVRDVSESVVDASRNAVGSTVDAVVGEDGVVSDAARGVGNAIKSGGTAAGELAESAADKVKSGLGSGKEAISNAASSVKAAGSSAATHAGSHSPGSVNRLSDGGHYVVLNVYGQQKNAQAFLKKNRAALRDARIYEDERGMYKAAVYVGRDRTVAERTAENLKRQGFARAWIYTK